MKLLLIRHARSVANAEGRLQGQTESPLSEEGKGQAKALAQRLVHQGLGISAVYASDLSRAAETAQIVASCLGLPVVLDERLREYDSGVLNGIVWQDVEFLYPEIWQGFYQRNEWVPIPGEEGNKTFRTRLAAVLAGILAEHENDPAVAVVTHGGSLGMILGYLLGLETPRPLPFHFDNASLTTIEFRRAVPILTLQNDTCHLDRIPR